VFLVALQLHRLHLVCLMQLVWAAESSCFWEWRSSRKLQNSLGSKGSPRGCLIRSLVQAGLTSKREQLCRSLSGQVMKTAGRRLHSLGSSSCVWHTISLWNFFLLMHPCEPGWQNVFAKLMCQAAFLFYLEMCCEKVFCWQHKKCANRGTLKSF